MHIFTSRSLAVLPFALLACVLVACGHRQRPPRRSGAEATADLYLQTVQSRAAFDLSCPAQQIGIRPLSAQAFGAIGCGRQASYTCVCTYHVWTSCTQAICSPDAISGAAPAVAPQPVVVQAAAVSNAAAAPPAQTAATGDFYQTVQARASFDLGCPAPQVAIRQLSPQAFGAVGCGRQASYSCICTYHVWTSCTQAACAPDAITSAPVAAPAPGTGPPATTAAPPAQGR